MALSNIEIDNFLREYAPHTYLNIYAYDQFDPTYCPYLPISIVINAYPASIKMGHWMAVYITHDRNGSFFDSFGLTAWGKCKDFLARHCKVAYFNTLTLQQNRISCGYHCVYFIFQMSKKLKMEQVLARYKHYSGSPDELVITFWNKRQPGLKK